MKRFALTILIMLINSVCFADHKNKKDIKVQNNTDIILKLAETDALIDRIILTQNPTNKIELSSISQELERIFTSKKIPSKKQARLIHLYALKIKEKITKYITREKDFRLSPSDINQVNQSNTDELSKQARYLSAIAKWLYVVSEK